MKKLKGLKTLKKEEMNSLKGGCGCGCRGRGRGRRCSGSSRCSR